MSVRRRISLSPRRRDQPRPARASHRRRHPREYTAKIYRAVCERIGITQSLGRGGSALDDAAIESSHSTLEWELRSQQCLGRKAQVHAKIAAWIDEYNRDRNTRAVTSAAPLLD